MNSLTPLNRLMLSVNKALALPVDVRPLDPELTRQIKSDAEAMHRATPSLAETILADAALAVAEGYPTFAQAWLVLRAAKDLVNAEREPEQMETREPRKDVYG